MNLCIYCALVADSVEHPLPAAFGEFENASLLENRICKKCNNEKLGILDEQLARGGPEAFFRKLYDVQGRTTHEKINPFERGSAGARRLDARAVDPKLGFEIGFEYEKGAFRPLRQIVFVEFRAGHPPRIAVQLATAEGQQSGLLSDSVIMTGRFGSAGPLFGLKQRFLAVSVLASKMK